ncbi:MAG TPA: ferrochelatase [Caldithrix abyssi]|uniref:Ferrochelatase n=1 Tax=Caldithrix abyssi TaxID=187145 RepID=A0A7V1LKV5_CALAY|nr:ferrochelatase [Caldithrix abyssi]
MKRPYARHSTGDSLLENDIKRIVLLVNLGSPASTEVDDVRRYLRQFLMDKYVIDAPYPIRKLIVEGFILPFRPKYSAEAYRAIWRPDGSPLIVLSEHLRAKLQEEISVPVALAMRYGEPSIGRVLENYPGLEEVLLIPLYPHYAMATTQTVEEEVTRVLGRKKKAIKLRVIPPFYEDKEYIEALYNSMASYLRQDYDHILFSYHGLPERHIYKSDPTGSHCLKKENCCHADSPAHKTCYRHQVIRTTELLARRAGIPAGKYTLAFQSRLGVDQWLKPSTAEILEKLPRQGVRKLLVACPSFVTDCLETLEEIGIQGKETFLQAGGESYTMIPCLNEHPQWVKLLALWSGSA